MLRQGITNESYHGSPELGRSVAWALNTTCPYKVKYDMDHPRESTPALAIGNAFHTATLEPGKFDDEVAVKPTEIDGKGSKTKHYREAFELMKKNEPGKIWLNTSDYDLVLDMASAALDNPVLKTYLSEVDAIVEGTGYFDMEGAECKVRPDLYLPGAGVVIDLKSTMDASEWGFKKSVRQFGYAFQACWYMHALRMMGEKPKQFIFVAVENSPPFVTKCWTIAERDIDAQFTSIEKACRTWAKCQETGVWPAYGDEVGKIDVSSAVLTNRLAIKPLAEKFGVSRTYVYRIIREYNIKAKSIGNRQLIDLTEFSKAVRRDQERKAA